MKIDLDTVRLFIRSRRSDLDTMAQTIGYDERELCGSKQELNVMEMFLDHFEQLDRTEQNAEK